MELRRKHNADGTFSLRTCPCGWRKTTSLRGLHIHQGRMRCLPNQKTRPAKPCATRKVKAMRGEGQVDAPEHPLPPVPALSMEIDEQGAEDQAIDACLKVHRAALRSQYTRDLYACLEVQQAGPAKHKQVSKKFAKHKDVLIDFLKEVHSHCQLCQETWELTMTILDHFTRGQSVRGGELLLASLTAMLVAAKYEEKSEEAWWYITENVFEREQILGMEQMMLRSLHFYTPEDPLPPVTEEESADMEEEELCQAFSETLLSTEDMEEQDVRDIEAYLRLLEVHPVAPEQLQLVGVTAVLLASKYEDRKNIPAVAQFAKITDSTYTEEEILVMEKVMLKSLHFHLGRPVPLHFLTRASKVESSSRETYILAQYLMELSLLDYDMVHVRPSEMAAASLCLSQLLLDGQSWSPTQRDYSTYDEAHLQPIMRRIAHNVDAVNEGGAKLTAVKDKYSSSKLMKISLHPELTSPVIRTMAASLL